MKWSYGVTTVSDRLNDLLPATLRSLAAAGFTQPRLFIDDFSAESTLPPEAAKLEVSSHAPRIRTFGNWVLAAWELYLRSPHADRYAIFQDDLVTYRNLRIYLESCPYPDRGYWNLYTFPENNQPTKGWYLSNQLGKGAVGIVFNNETIRTLLQQQHFIDRPLDHKRGHRGVDGGIVTALQQAGWSEYVHNPSLVQHTGEMSSMGSRKHDLATTFLGEHVDISERAVPKMRVEPAVLPQQSRVPRIGLVGYNCSSGLGELNRQIATFCDVDKWLVKPHDVYPTLPDHPDVDTIHCPTGVKVEEFLRTVDVVVFCETPYYPNLIEQAKAAGKRIVCVPMQEWMPSGCNGWPMQVDLFLCPTKQAYDLFAHVVPCIYFPWPVDTDRFKPRLRTTFSKFLFINGHGGFAGRKGAEVVRDTLELFPEMPLLVRSQRQENWPANTQFIGAVANNADLYDQGDVLIAPHSVDGLGLEPMEAMACGMPVITTEGRPWDEIPAMSRIPARVEKRKVRRPVDWYLPDPGALVVICNAVIQSHRINPKMMAEDSQKAIDWAQSRGWHLHRNTFNDLVRYGVRYEPAASA